MVLNIQVIGLLLDILGVLILWFTGDYLSRRNIMFQSTSTTSMASWGGHSFFSGAKTVILLKKNYMNRLSLLLLVLGFVCQIAGYYISTTVPFVDSLIVVLAVFLSVTITYQLLGKKLLLFKSVELICNSPVFKKDKLNGEYSFKLILEIARAAQELKIGKYPDSPKTSKDIEQYVDDVLAWRGGL